MPHSRFPRSCTIQRSVVRRHHPAFGTDAAVLPHGLNAKEFSAMVAAGKLADLIAMSGNPQHGAPTSCSRRGPRSTP